MKRFYFVVLAIFMVMGLAVTGVLQSVQANQQTNNNPGGSTSTPTPTSTALPVVGVADGDWTSGQDSGGDLSKVKPPKSYLQLLGEEVEATNKGMICHPFHGGQFGWTGRIYMLDNGQWIPAKTFFMWYPDAEGEFMACTNAQPGGIYALFGSYSNASNPTATLKPSATPTRTPTPKPTAKPPVTGPTQMSRQ